VALTAGNQGGQARIVCTESRTGQQRAALVAVYAETQLISDFSTAEAWESKGATLTLQDGLGKITTPGQFAAMRKWVDVDFDRGPLVEINVPQVEGAWAMKVNDGTLPVDILVQPDGGQTGRFTYDLATMTGWKGKKRVELIVFAIGTGKSVFVDEVKVHYRK
jgi:hypothetical protein